MQKGDYKKKKSAETLLMDEPSANVQDAGRSNFNNSIVNHTENVKQKQLEIIEKVNPAPNTYNTWIRKVEDIKTLAETLEDSDWADGDEFNPDLTREMIEEAIESGEITVYSSYPIGQGVFVSPSYMEAASYSGDGNVYEKTVSIDDVAWIDPTQGMYASTTENQNVQFSLSDNIENSEKTLYNKNSPLAIVDRAKSNNNSSINWVYKSEIFSVTENKLFHEKISEINQGSQAFEKNARGEYMIPIGNKIIFTDGNYESPYIREIVEVLTEHQTRFDDIRECIFSVEKGRSDRYATARYVQNTFGEGRIVSYTSRNNGVYEWENGKRKGKTRRTVVRNYLNKRYRTGNDKQSQETQIKEIAPIKETSSKAGVFSNGEKTKFSLNDSEGRNLNGRFHGKDMMLDVPIRSDIATTKTVAEEDIAPPLKSSKKKGDIEQPIAKILTKEPEFKENSPLWSKIKTNFIDKASPFETLALKTGNREVDAKFNSIRYSDSKAQTLIGEGADGVKALNDIKTEVEKNGLTEALYEYLYHKHNVDRMTLEDRYDDVPNKAVFGDNMTADLSQKIVERYETENPELIGYAEDVYNYNKYLRNLLVEGGVISQEIADLVM